MTCTNELFILVVNYW